MLEAVLFDWGDTLMRWVWDPELLAVSHDAGLRALGRAPVAGLTERFRTTYMPLMFAPGTLEEVEYSGLVRRLLSDLGVEVNEAELERYIEAEHAAWSPARQSVDASHPLLETLRRRGLKIGLVSNAFDPPALLHRDLDELGISERIDFAVFSSETGRRKPDAVIFERALEALDVAADRALFVGDTVATDIAGAAALGMPTCQAMWFRVDDQGTPAPDFQAHTHDDLLAAVDTLVEAGP